VEFAIDPAKFHDAFAADVPEEEPRVMAATQRPVLRVRIHRAERDAGLKRLPSWRWWPPATRPPAATWCADGRAAGATISEVDASHVVMITSRRL
jgi:hypothetical protein